MVCLWPFVRRSTDSFKPGDRFNCTSGPANLSFTLRVAICTGGKIFEILIERNLYLHFLNARGIHIYIYPSDRRKMQFRHGREQIFLFLETRPTEVK